MVVAVWLVFFSSEMNFWAGILRSKSYSRNTRRPHCPKVRTPAQYIGLIGSRGKIGAIFKNLRKSDITTEDLKRVRAPVGLDIGARSPEEISVAIVAEMIAFRRGLAPSPRSPLKLSNRAEQNKSTTTSD